MRVLPATLVALFVVTTCSSAWSQGDSPFAQADPFGPGPVRPRQQNATPAGTARDAVIQRAKQVLTDGRKPVHLGTPKQYETERRIHAALDDATTVTFIELPLQDAMQNLSTIHDIPIVIDRRALEEIGLSPDLTVNIDLKKVSLRSLLRLMLREFDLTYLIKDEVMQITTFEAAEQNLVLEMYVLPANLAAKSDQVIKVLTATVVPDTWQNLGGPSVVNSVDHVLVVSTTSDVHEKAKQFLAMLSEKYGK